MLKIGEVIRGDKLGKRMNDYYTWIGCPVCHKERWVLRWKLTLLNFTGLCQVCSARKNTNRSEAIGVRHPRWNGGQTISRGYVYVFNNEHPAKTSKGYVKRARLVLEEKLGRYLLLDCIPHHINGIKHDDRPSNLLELTKSQHTILHAFERRLIAKGQSLGRKEVVEYVTNQIIYGVSESEYRDWQAKLEEWWIDVRS